MNTIQVTARNLKPASTCPGERKKPRMFECLLLLICNLPCYIYMEWRDIYWALFLKLNLIHNLLRISIPKITMTSELANQNFEQKFGNHASLDNCWQAVLRSAGSVNNVCESSPTFPWCRLLRKTRLDMLDFNIPNFLFYQKNTHCQIILQLIPFLYSNNHPCLTIEYSSSL